MLFGIYACVGMSSVGSKETAVKGTKTDSKAAALRDAQRQDLLMDDHVRIFGKRAEDVVYTDKVCDRCLSRIDEFGHCACGAGGN